MLELTTESSELRLLELPDTQDAVRIRAWLNLQTSTETRRKYRQQLARFLIWADCALAEVTLPLILSYREALAEAGLSARSRNAALTTLRSLFGALTRFWPDESWPNLSGVRDESARDSLPERILTVAEMQALLAAAQSDELFIRFTYELAARVHEAVGVRWVDLLAHPAGSLVTLFGKGGKTRSIVLGRPTNDHVLALKRRSELIWPFSTRTAGRIIERAAVAAGLSRKPSPHWLRHARLTHLAGLGLPLMEIRDFAGHASIQTTNRYLHVSGALPVMPDTLEVDRD